MLPVAVALSSSDNNAISYVLTVFWMMSCLPIIGQVKAMPTGHILRVTNKGAELRAKSDLYDCLVYK